MSAMDFQSTHEEHNEAGCEHAMWLEDIGRWRAEHRRAASMLAQAQAALLDQDAALEAHAETVRAHELRVQWHEREIAVQARDSGRLTNGTLVSSHHEYQVEHERAREAHRRIKEHHGIVTAEIRRLSKKLGAAM